MDSIVATLKANGMTTKNVVRCLVMLADMKEWEAFNRVYVTYFEPPYPARSAFGCSGLEFVPERAVVVVAERVPVTVREVVALRVAGRRAGEESQDAHSVGECHRRCEDDEKDVARRPEPSGPGTGRVGRRAIRTQPAREPGAE